MKTISKVIALMIATAFVTHDASATGNFTLKQRRENFNKKQRAIGQDSRLGLVGNNATKNVPQQKNERTPEKINNTTNKVVQTPEIKAIKEAIEKDKAEGTLVEKALRNKIHTIKGKDTTLYLHDDDGIITAALKHNNAPEENEYSTKVDEIAQWIEGLIGGNL